MEKRIHLFVSRKNVLTWLMALCLVGSAVARIVIPCVKGTWDSLEVWSQIVLPVAATLLFVLITLINLIAIHRLVPRRPDYFSVFYKPVLATAAMAVVARGSYSLLLRLTDGSRVAVLAAIALAVAVYAMAALLLGAIRRQDLLALPKGEKLADILHIH